MIYKFRPLFKPTLWGGTRIAAFKNVATTQTNIGESWEISAVDGSESVVDGGLSDGLTLSQLIRRDGKSLVGTKNYERFGTKFPLLIKFIDAREDLSVQVHPDDSLARKRHNCSGKTEMWYVVGAEPGAHLCSGLSKPLDSESYMSASEDGSIGSFLQDHKVSPGDVFFIPAGRIHSIGSGCFIAEIQQTSDITYRIYDFDRTDANGNKRELHPALAKDAIDYTLSDDYRTRTTIRPGRCVPLVECPYFRTRLFETETPEGINIPVDDSFVIVMSVEGEAGIETPDSHATLRQGQTALVSASSRSLSISPASNKFKALVVDLI